MKKIGRHFDAPMAVVCGHEPADLWHHAVKSPRFSTHTFIAFTHAVPNGSRSKEEPALPNSLHVCLTTATGSYIYY
jgi:hypothetical protein